MSTMQITMRHAARSEDGLRTLYVGQTYVVGRDFGLRLVQMGWAVPVEDLTGTAPYTSGGAAKVQPLGPSHYGLDLGTAGVYPLPSGPVLPKPTPRAGIALPPYARAMWWPLDEGTGGVVQDSVHGMSAELIGATANAWDTPGVLTLAADTAVRLQNAAPVLDIMRLDNLTGTLIVGIEVGGGIPASSPVAYAWGYGDASVSSGAIGGIVNASQLALFGYRAVSGSLTTLSGLMGNIKTLGRHMFHWVIHRNLFEGRLYIEGYIDGWQSRGSRVAALEGAESPVGDNSRGLRIGARPTGLSGTTNYLGANGAAPQIANFHAIRLEGDYRHRIPGWINNICATIPYGAVPEVLNHG